MTPPPAPAPPGPGGRPAEGGKSRTWNRFVHDLSRPDADLLVFADADITLPDPDALARLILALAGRPALWVLNSQPVKDTALRGPRTLVERLALKASGGLDDWKTAICGQLYAMPAARARRFRLPIGLPVEDGFLRAMVLTDALAAPEDLGRIDGLDGLRHVYASESTLAGLLRHQERIVIGSAINAALFAHLRALPPAARGAELDRLSTDPAALRGVLRQALPRAPYGFVPFHFLVKRLARAGWLNCRLHCWVFASTRLSMPGRKCAWRAAPGRGSGDRSCLIPGKSGRKCGINVALSHPAT